MFSPYFKPILLWASQGKPSYDPRKQLEARAQVVWEDLQRIVREREAA
jgi:hypothetical protein